MTRALAIALIGLGIALAQAPAQTVSARVGGELTGFPGSIVLVPVAIDMSGSGGEKLGSYTARLTWDPARLKACLGYDYYYSCVDSIRGGSFPVPQFNYDSAAGTLSFTAISPAGAPGLVTIARIPFVLRDTLAAPLTLTFSEMSAAGTFTNLLPLLSVSSATMCPARGRWGDIDRDGNANSRDALITLSTVVGLPVDSTFDMSLADVNADGNVRSVDALIILSYAVGIDIPGQRVLLLAPTSCGTGSARTLAIDPPSAELVPSQPLPLLLQARDSAGRLVTISDAVWRSSDYDVATVDANGVVSGRAAGTATITGEVGPGVRATATITVVAGRTSWIVDARATGAAVQLGNAAFPMDHPTRAFAYVREGDTIRVASGNYDFDNTSGLGDVAPIMPGATRPALGYGFNDDQPLDVGVVILGGTPGDTTTRPVFRSTRYYGVRGLWLRGGNRTSVKNVVFRDMDPAVEIDGVRNFVLEDSRVEIVNPDNFGDGVYNCTNASMDTLRIERTVMVGDSSGDAINFNGCSSDLSARVMIIRDSKILNWSNGIYAYEIDSTAVIRSVISGNEGYGISLRQENVVNPSLYVARSRFEHNYYEAIQASNARRLVVDTSVVLADQDDAIDVDGGCGECSGDTETQVYLRGDTIAMFADDYNWLRVYLADTLVIDGTVVNFADVANFYVYGNAYARNARITNSQFLNVAAGEVLYFQGQRFYADSVTMTACSQPTGCDGAYGFELYPSGGTLDAFVHRSSFDRIRYPLYSGGGSAGVHVASELTINRAEVGIDMGGDSTIVADNQISSAYGAAIRLGGYTGTRGASTVSGNSIGCDVPPGENPAYGIVVNATQVVLVERNTIDDPICNVGILISRMNSGSVVRGNALRRITDQAISVNVVDTTLVAIDSNVISGEGTGTGTGIGVANGRVLATRNNIGNGLFHGMFVYTTGYLQEAHGNAFSGNTGSALTALTDTVDAINNWWGNPAGPTQPDSVNGRIAVTPFLPTAPLDLPSFAPRMLMTGAVAPQPATPRRASGVPPAHVRAVRPAPAPKRPRVVAPERAARVQQQEAERASRQGRRPGPS